MDSKPSIIVKSLFCFSIIAATYAIIVAHFNPATGYELSIYSLTPTVCWVFIILGAGSGFGIIAYLLYTDKLQSYHWILGLAALIFCRLTIHYLPFIRGYYSWNQDHFAHIGYVKDIMFSGHVPDYNFYPISHIFASVLVSIASVPPEISVNYCTSFFSVLYVVSVYLLSREVFKDRRNQLWTLALTTAAMFGIFYYLFLPNGLSALLLPLLMLCYFKNARGYMVALLILLLVYPLFHPLSLVILVLILITTGVARLLYFYLTNISIPKKQIISMFPIGWLLLTLAIYASWILVFNEFPGLNILLRKTIHSLTALQGSDNVVVVGQTLDKLGLSGWDLVSFFVFYRGISVFYLALFCLVVVSFGYCIYKKNFGKVSLNFWILTLVTSTICFVYLAYLLNIIPGLENINAERIFNFTTLFTPIFGGYVFARLCAKKGALMYIFSALLIIMLIALSILSLYHSPLMMRNNLQLTQMDIQGADWLLDYGSSSFADTYITTTPTFFLAEGILGKEGGVERANIHRNAPQIPDHFYYYDSDYLGEYYGSDMYALIAWRDYITYTGVWKPVGRFDKEDFIRLNYDISVSCLYQNGEAQIIYIKSKGVPES